MKKIELKDCVVTVDCTPETIPIGSIVPSTDDRTITDYRPNSAIDIAILVLLSIAAIALFAHIRSIWHKLYNND